MNLRQDSAKFANLTLSRIENIVNKYDSKDQNSLRKYLLKQDFVLCNFVSDPKYNLKENPIKFQISYKYKYNDTNRKG